MFLIEAKLEAKRESKINMVEAKREQNISKLRCGLSFGSGVGDCGFGCRS